MKQIYIFISILILNCICVTAQNVTDIITEIGEPNFLFLSGNDLYFSEKSENKISKIDISIPTPIVIDVVTGLIDPQCMIVNGNDIYVAQGPNRNQGIEGKVSKIDISGPEPIITDIATIENPVGLAMNGNILYVSDFPNDSIYEIDISIASPTATLIVDGLNGPQSLALNGDDLYVAVSIEDKISKIDFSGDQPIVTDVLTTGLDFPRGIAFNGNELYVANFFDDLILKINDITAAPIAITNLVDGLDGPMGLAVDASKGELYISIFNEGKISKISIPTTLTVPDYLALESLKLYPNPSNDFITLIGLSKTEDFKIFDISGKKVSQGFISNNGKIDIQNLSNNMYFLQFKKGNAIKFLKE